MGIAQLRELKLRITDYTETKELNNAISRYFILLNMTFDMTNIFKIFETPTSQIYKQAVSTTPVNIAPRQLTLSPIAQIEYECPKCKNKIRLQANFIKDIPMQNGFIQFPQNNKIVCPQCGIESDVSIIRMKIESQTRRRIV